MIIHLQTMGGPLDGALHFDDQEPRPKGLSITDLLRWNVYEYTKGEIGVGAMSSSPEMLERSMKGLLTREEAETSTIHRYIIHARELVEGELYLRADHVPEYRKAFPPQITFDLEEE